MKSLIKPIVFSFLLFAIIACSKQLNKENNLFPSDKNATEQTVQLMSTLNSRIEKGIMLGHQDDLAYGNKWYDEPGRSDVKAVCGDYPAAFGWDIGDIELGASFNSDSISFTKLKSYINQVNELGGVSTLTWFAHNPVTGGEYTDLSTDLIVKSVLTNQDAQNRFFSYLDNLADFFNNLKDENGKLIPVIFQPFQEYNVRDKYWWSKDKCSANEYKEIWKMTVDYLRNKKNIHHLLYSYSVHADSISNAAEDYYPGNDYVDIIGVSLNFIQENDPTGKIYMQTLNRNLDVTGRFAEKNKKISALTSTGQEGIKVPDYFSNYLLPIVSQYKLSYIMFGKNSWTDEKHYFIPVPGHPASEDFELFSKNPRILTCSKIS